MTAALYLARARCRVVVVEKERFGGQVTIDEEIRREMGGCCKIQNLQHFLFL